MGRRKYLGLAVMILCAALLLSACIRINIADGGSDASESGNDQKPKQQALQEDDEPALSEEDVMEILLKRVPGATVDDIASFYLDMEDGRWEYEGKLVYDGIEYEFVIDAKTGNILEWELDD